MTTESDIDFNMDIVCGSGFNNHKPQTFVDTSSAEFCQTEPGLGNDKTYNDLALRVI